MEEQFFILYERHDNLALEVGHNSIADWCVTVYDRKGKHLRDGERIIGVQDCGRRRAFARAYIELTEYLSENRGGY